MECPWNGPFHMESIWTPWLAWNEKMARLPAKNSPYGVHGRGLESTHSIWNIPGSAKTSLQQLDLNDDALKPGT